LSNTSRVSLEFNSFLDYYKNAPDLNAPAEERFSKERDGGDRFARTGVRGDFTRLFINLGSVDGFSRGDLLGYICNSTKISGRTVGKIDVKGVYSFFEVPHAEVEKIQSGFKGIDFHGRDVRIEIAGDGVSTNRDGGSRDRKSYGGRNDGHRREGGNRDRNNYGGERREGGGFRDFSGKRREDRGERRKRF